MRREKWTGAGMAGACQMKASKSALKSAHTFPFSPYLYGCASVRCRLDLRSTLYTLLNVVA